MLQLVILFFVYSGVAQCWNLVLGISGIFSLAQGTLFAIGGYTAGLLAVHGGWSPWLVLLVGPLGAVVASLLIGLPILRLRGVYVALLTLAFHELVRNVLATGPEFFGRGFGLRVPVLFSGDNGLLFNYYLAMAIFLGTTLAVWRLIHSPLGLALAALRDAEGYAIGRGVSPYRLRLSLFVVTAALIGLAGSFMVVWQGIATPGTLDFNLLFTLLMMIVLGGWATFAGPIVGAAFLIWLTEIVLKPHDPAMQGIALGTLLIAVVLITPQGLVPLTRGVWERIRSYYDQFE